MKHILIATAALTMTASIASANPDKWDQRGSVENNKKTEVVYQDLFKASSEFGIYASLNDEMEVSTTHKHRHKNK